jgi:hypothetical protein
MVPTFDVGTAPWRPTSTLESGNCFSPRLLRNQRDDLATRAPRTGRTVVENLEARDYARSAVECILEYEEPGREDDTDWWLDVFNEPDKHRISFLQREPREAAEHLEILSTCLSGGDWVVRAAAVTGLGRMDDPGVYEPLCGALEDPNPEVREAALTALADAINDRVRERAIRDYPNQIPWHRAIRTLKVRPVNMEKRTERTPAWPSMSPSGTRISSFPTRSFS